MRERNIYSRCCERKPLDNCQKITRYHLTRASAKTYQHNPQPGSVCGKWRYHAVISPLNLLQLSLRQHRFLMKPGGCPASADLRSRPVGSRNVIAPAGLKELPSLVSASSAEASTTHAGPSDSDWWHQSVCYTLG